MAITREQVMEQMCRCDECRRKQNTSLRHVSSVATAQRNMMTNSAMSGRGYSNGFDSLDALVYGAQSVFARPEVSIHTVHGDADISEFIISESPVALTSYYMPQYRSIEQIFSESSSTVSDNALLLLAAIDGANPEKPVKIPGVGSVRVVDGVKYFRVYC